MLLQKWMHSHEEDTAGEMVFRPAAFAFPPSRNRMGYAFHADQSVAAVSPGAADVPDERKERWALTEDGKQLQFFRPGEKQPYQTWGIRQMKDDKLVVQK